MKMKRLTNGAAAYNNMSKPLATDHSVTVLFHIVNNFTSGKLETPYFVIKRPSAPIWDILFRAIHLSVAFVITLNKISYL